MYVSLVIHMVRAVEDTVLLDPRVGLCLIKRLWCSRKSNVFERRQTVFKSQLLHSPELWDLDTLTCIN